MSIDWTEIADGMAGTLHDLGDILWPIVTGMEPWVLVLICLFCGAWMVQFLDRLMNVLLFGWLRWLRRLWLLGFSGWCVFPGCGGPTAYCPLSRPRGNDSLPVPSSSRPDGGGRRAQSIPRCKHVRRQAA